MSPLPVLAGQNGPASRSPSMAWRAGGHGRFSPRITPADKMRPQHGAAMDDTTTMNFAANLARYEALMEVVRGRMTSRQFRTDVSVPREHIEMVLEAARHAPSG